MDGREEERRKRLFKSQKRRETDNVESFSFSRGIDSALSTEYTANTERLISSNRKKESHRQSLFSHLNTTASSLLLTEDRQHTYILRRN